MHARLHRLLLGPAAARLGVVSPPLRDGDARLAHRPQECAEECGGPQGQRARQARAARKGSRAHRGPPQEGDALLLRGAKGAGEAAREHRGALPQGSPRTLPPRGRLPGRRQVQGGHGGARPHQVPEARHKGNRGDGARPRARDPEADGSVPAGGHCLALQLRGRYRADPRRGARAIDDAAAAADRIRAAAAAAAATAATRAVGVSTAAATAQRSRRCRASGCNGCSGKAVGREQVSTRSQWHVLGTFGHPFPFAARSLDRCTELALTVTNLWSA
mmetsp:Transcript_8799/g.27747  ORF Transcript_8799/g.27747 Transcript_8799/m.27747 type:complete len:275 (+) Transcript_8799:743-1567(+)